MKKKEQKWKEKKRKENQPDPGRVWVMETIGGGRKRNVFHQREQHVESLKVWKSIECLGGNKWFEVSRFEVIGQSMFYFLFHFLSLFMYVTVFSNRLYTYLRTGVHAPPQYLS